MAVTLTETAAREVKTLLKQQQEASNSNGEVAKLYLRVGVKGGGCSGLSYTMDLQAEPDAGDQVIESKGIRIFIDLGSSLYLSGTVLDFSDGLNGSGFTFENPNATRTCGCGQSFSA